MPKPNRDAIEQEEEIFNYLKQSHISAKNTARLRTLAASDDPRLGELAAIVIEVAEVKPFKKRRLQVLARERRDLLDALERTGLIAAHHG
jgi:succinylglutamate desuccinylase